MAMFARRAEVVEREAARIGALAVPGDLTRLPPTSSGSWTRRVEAFGGIDVVVLNGGGPTPGAASRRRPPTAVTAAVELLLVPHVTLVGLCLPHLRASGRGRIIAIESTSVKEPIAEPRALERRPAGRRRLAEDAVPRGRARRHHRQHDRAGPDRHRAAAGPLRRATARRRSCSPRSRPPHRHARRDRRDGVLPRLGAGRLHQRRGRAGRRRPPERALLSVTGNAFDVLLWASAAVAAALFGAGLVRPAARLPLRPEHGARPSPPRSTSRARSRGAGPGRHLLRRRHDPPGDLGGAAAPVPAARRRDARAARRGRASGSSLRRPGTRTGCEEMARSEKVAAAVALKQAGFKVRTDATRGARRGGGDATRRRRRSSTRAT